MITKSDNSYFSFLIIVINVILINNICLAQDTLQKNILSNNLEKNEIQWINQWPKAADIQDKEKNRSLKDIITGNKKQKLKRPVSIYVENKDTYWILDQERNSILQVKKGVIKTLRYIDKKNFMFTSLVGICKFKNDKILFTDSYLNKIFLLDPEKKECTVLNDSLKLDKPTGIAYSQITNEIWVLETGAHRILVLNEKGEPIKKIGSRGKANGEFNFPTHIWIDNTGNAYVVDAMNFRIQVFNKEGNILSVFGTNGDATGYFASPKGIATDTYGHIYIADALFHAIQIFDMNGNFLYTFGSQGRDEGQFWMPSGIYIDENNKIYIADSYNSRIQVFQFNP